jgi:hypothetical protein
MHRPEHHTCCEPSAEAGGRPRNRRLLPAARSAFIALLVVLLLVGCASKDKQKSKPSPTTAAAFDASQPRVLSLVQGSELPGEPAPQDAQPAIPILFQLEVYSLPLPYGTISRNEDFWKRINEQCISVGLYDALYKNGIRVGEAPYSEFAQFRKVIEENPGVGKKYAVAATTSKDVEMAMKKCDTQTIWYSDASGIGTGRTYDYGATNLFMLSFQPAPRKTGEVRLKLCPVIRENRKRLQINSLNEETEIAYVSKQSFFDLALSVDIPLEHFLVIAPSPESKWNSSLGEAFLQQDGNAQKLEQVLIVIARPYRLDDQNRPTIDDAPVAKQ